MKRIFNSLIVSTILLLMTGCSPDNSFVPYHIALNFRLVDQTGTLNVETESSNDEAIVEYYKVSSYNNSHAVYTTGGYGNDITAGPLHNTISPDAAPVYNLRLLCFVVNDSTQEPYDRSEIEIVSEEIFGDSKTHIINVIWDTEGSYYQWLPKSVTIDGVNYEVKEVNEKGYDLVGIEYVRK